MDVTLVTFEAFHFSLALHQRPKAYGVVPGSGRLQIKTIGIGCYKGGNMFC